MHHGHRHRHSLQTNYQELILKKQKVETGKANDNFIIIHKGIKPGDEVTLNLPEK